MGVRAKLKLLRPADFLWITRQESVVIILLAEKRQGTSE